MSNVGYATLTIIPSAKGFSKALGGEVDPGMKAAGDAGGKALGGGILGAAKGFLGPLAAVFGAAAVGGFFKSTIAEASGLNESLNALSVTYGDNAKGIEALGQKAARSLGLSNLEFNNMAVQFSAAAKQIAGPGGDVVKTMDDLSTRASDFASVMNLEVADAALIFQSALAGETEPIRKFGIDLSAASVQAYAYANGIAKSGEELTQAQKTQAIYGSLMEQTAQTQGDFANTSDQLANRQRILSSLWTDGKARLGTAFLPAVNAVVGLLIQGLAPALDLAVNGVNLLVGAASLLKTGDFTGKIGEMLGGVQEDAPIVDFLLTVRDKIGGIATSIGEAFGPVIPQIVAAFSSLAGPLTSILPMLSPLGLIFQALQPVLPQVAGLIGTLAVALATGLGAVLPSISSLLGTVVSILSGVFVQIMPTIVGLVQSLAGVFVALMPAIGTLVAAIAPLIAQLLGQLAPIFVQLVNVILPPLTTIFGLIAEAVGPLVGILIGVLGPAIQGLMPIITTVFGAIVPIIQAAMQIVQGIIEVVTGLITGNWDQVWSGIQNVLGGVWNAIVSIIQGALQIVGAVITGVLTFIGGLFVSVWNAVGKTVTDAWNGLTNAVSTGVSNVIGFLTGLPGQAISALANIGTALLDIGKNLIQGFLDGINSAWKLVSKTIRDLFGGAVDLVKGILGIHSPSKVFRQLGLHTGEGMALGLKDSAGLIEDAADALVPTLPPIASPDVEAGGVYGALTRAGATGSTEFNYTQIGGEGLTSDQELTRAARRLKQALRK